MVRCQTQSDSYCVPCKPTPPLRNKEGTSGWLWVRCSLTLEKARTQHHWRLYCLVARSTVAQSDSSLATCLNLPLYLMTTSSIHKPLRSEGIKTGISHILRQDTIPSSRLVSTSLELLTACLHPSLLPTPKMPVLSIPAGKHHSPKPQVKGPAPAQHPAREGSSSRNAHGTCLSAMASEVRKNLACCTQGCNVLQGRVLGPPHLLLLSETPTTPQQGPGAEHGGLRPPSPGDCLPRTPLASPFLPVYFPASWADPTPSWPNPRAVVSSTCRSRTLGSLPFAALSW